MIQKATMVILAIMIIIKVSVMTVVIKNVIEVMFYSSKLF